MRGPTGPGRALGRLLKERSLNAEGKMHNAEQRSGIFAFCILPFALLLRATEAID
jgi:hypothetical protein